jgi:glycosyltransferase involved in cell wall biosynthesis
MRIAIVTPGFSADDDDWCIPILRDMAVAFHERHDVTVYATCFPFQSGAYTVLGVPVRAFGDGKQGRIAWWRRQRRAVAALVADHDAAPFEIVHGFWADGGGYVCARFRRLRGAPTVVTVMGGELVHEPSSGYGKRRRPIGGRLARYGARAAMSLNVGSVWHRDIVIRQQPDIRPQIVRLGVDPFRFNEAAPPVDLAGDIPVLCVASLIRVKGHEPLLTAFTDAGRELDGLHLHLVGEGTLAADLRSLADRLGIGGRVTFHGHVGRERLPAYYRAAAFCILNSYFENHGMVVVEAAACGRVTIGTAVGSMPQLCPPALLCKPGDAPALAMNILKLAQDRALRREAAQFAATTVSRDYTLPQTISAFEGVYRELLQWPARA